MINFRTDLDILEDCLKEASRNWAVSQSLEKVRLALIEDKIESSQMEHVRSLVERVEKLPPDGSFQGGGTF